VALEVDGRVEVGLVSAPALRRRWWATRGGGAFADDVPISVSRVSDVENAHIGYDDIPVMEEHGLDDAFLALARKAWRSRGFGDFWIHVLVAEGALDVAVEPVVAPWDLGPMPVIVEEAGGRFTDLSGSVSIDGGSALSTNGLLHDAVLEALRR
jgi:histidinol-phosphatase